jgi:hypothetical protein
MTKLSVNINKIATLRNSRGGNNPNLIATALDIERFGANGITVHPRPDERHIRYADVFDLKKAIHTELNIEGKIILLEKSFENIEDYSNLLKSDSFWSKITEENVLMFQYDQLIRYRSVKVIHDSYVIDILSFSSLLLIVLIELID